MRIAKLIAGGVVGRGRAVPWYLKGSVAKADCLAAYQFIGASSQAESYTNLVNPGAFTIIDGVAPDWSAALGLIFTDGKWINTQVRNVAGSSISVVVRFSDDNSPTGDVYFLGAPQDDSLAYIAMRPRQVGKAVWTNRASYTHSALFTGGVSILSNMNAYHDGALLGTISGTPCGTINNGRFYVGGLCSSASTLAVYAPRLICNIQALAFYRIGLSSDQVGEITAAVAALTENSTPF